MFLAVDKAMQPSNLGFDGTSSPGLGGNDAWIVIACMSVEILLSEQPAIRVRARVKRQTR